MSGREREQATAPMSGGCLCGAVRFSVSAERLSAHICHCAMCRRWGGGPAFAVDCGDAVAFEGEGDIRLHRSSEWAERAFCAVCGSGLYWRAVEGAGIGRDYILNAGLFDDQSRLTLGGEIFVDDAPGWYSFAGEHPRKTGEETVAEFNAAIAAGEKPQ